MAACLCAAASKQAKRVWVQGQDVPSCWIGRHGVVQDSLAIVGARKGWMAVEKARSGLDRAPICIPSESDPNRWTERDQVLPTRFFCMCGMTTKALQFRFGSVAENSSRSRLVETAASEWQ
jgi:hypothetical protein